MPVNRTPAGGRPRRAGALSVAIDLALALADGVAVAAAVLAGAGPAAAAVTAVAAPSAVVVRPSVAVPDRGGPVAVAVAVDRAASCELSSSPVVRGWARSFPCRRALVRRTAIIPPDLGRARRFVLWIAVSGPGGRIVRGETVHQAGAPAPAAVPLVVSTTVLAPATLGTPYSAQLAASGGSPPYIWALAAGSLPAGLSLSPGGLVSGVPELPGVATLEVVVRDGASTEPQSATAVLSLSVVEPALPVVATRNWSGYEVGGGPFTAASASFDVPDLVARAGPASTSEWVGVDGSGNTSLIQAGVEESVQPGSSVDVEAWWEILPAPATPIPLAVAPGDTVAVSLASGGGGIWTISVTDTTTGQSFTTAQSYGGPADSVEWIVEAPSTASSGAVLTLGDYAPDVTFSDPTFSGDATSRVEVVLVQGGAVVSVPSALGPSGFAVAYGATAPPPP